MISYTWSQARGWLPISFAILTMMLTSTSHHLSCIPHRLTSHKQRTPSWQVYQLHSPQHSSLLTQLPASYRGEWFLGIAWLSRLYQLHPQHWSIKISIDNWSHDQLRRMFSNTKLYISQIFAAVGMLHACSSALLVSTQVLSPDMKTSDTTGSTRYWS